jgi:hypothetical protein
MNNMFIHLRKTDARVLEALVAKFTFNVNMRNVILT